MEIRIPGTFRLMNLSLSQAGLWQLLRLAGLPVLGTGSAGTEKPPQLRREPGLLRNRRGDLQRLHRELPERAECRGVR